MYSAELLKLYAFLGLFVALVMTFVGKEDEFPKRAFLLYVGFFPLHVLVLGFLGVAVVLLGFLALGLWYLLVECWKFFRWLCGCIEWTTLGELMKRDK